MDKTYYETLNIGINATDMEIKLAYSNKVKEYPPEGNPKEFNEVQKSYDLLKDKKQRSIYDYELAIENKQLEKYKEAEKYLLNSLRLVPRIDYAVLLDLIYIANITGNKKLVDETKETLIRTVDKINFNHINHRLVDMIIEEIQKDRIVRALEITVFSKEIIEVVGDRELLDKYLEMEAALKIDIYKYIIECNEKYKNKISINMW